MGVIKCGKYYYFRGYVPKKLLIYFKYKTISKTLRTRNKTEAIRKVKNVKLNFQNLMMKVELIVHNVKELQNNESIYRT